MSMGGQRRLVQVFPDSVREWWDKWEIDTMVWCSYLLADKVPSIALGAISSKLGDYHDKHGQQIMENPHLIAFWAPFFLMHIGGPDTITAYSLEDNELWLRHLIGLVVQTLLTLYIILMSWETTSWVSYFSIPILVIGFVKYGERTWSLYSASSNYDGDWIVASYVSKSEELSYEKTIADATRRAQFKVIIVSHFSDMVISTIDIKKLKEENLSQSFTDAFHEADDTNGASYDIFYTKALAALTIWGFISRVISLLVLVLVLTLYIIFNTERSRYSRLDRTITYILLVGAIILHLVSTTLLVFSSEWTEVLFETIECSMPFAQRLNAWFKEKKLGKRQSNSIGQCNFLTTLCSEKRRFKIYGASLPIRELEKIEILSPCPVSSELMEMVFDNIVKKSKESAPIQSPLGPQYREIVKDQALSRRRSIIENLEFHQTILLWHIVTDICYYCDDNKDALESEIHSRESKRLSDYMFYLLVKQRHMLPIGTGLPSLRDTIVEAMEYCKQNKTLNLASNVSESCKTLLQHIAEDTEFIESYPNGRSVFRYAFVAAHDLLGRGNMKQIWVFLMELWIEILNYSAAHCRADRHIQQLRYGGEFLTDVWTLQFLYGLLEQFQLTQPFFEDDNI